MTERKNFIDSRRAPRLPRDSYQPEVMLGAVVLCLIVAAMVGTIVWFFR